MGGDDLLGEGVCVRAGGDPEGPEGGGEGLRGGTVGLGGSVRGERGVCGGVLWG